MKSLRMRTLVSLSKLMKYNRLRILLPFLKIVISSCSSTTVSPEPSTTTSPHKALLPAIASEQFLATFLVTGNTSSKPASMAWRCTGTTNAELIANLRKASLIKSPIVADAMARVDRAHYAPRSAYEDSPQQIGFAATISAPHMHASACESLLPFLKPGSRVLDVGSGSGYLTHVLAEVQAGQGDNGAGKVVGIDHIQGLVDMSRKNMMKSEQGRRLLESKNVELVCGDGRKGYPPAAPYDAIHVGAAAKEMHEDLINQLKAPGRMFIPVDDGDGWGSQWIWVVDKDEKGQVKRQKDMGVRYVPLTDAPK